MLIFVVLNIFWLIHSSSFYRWMLHSSVFEILISAQGGLMMIAWSQGSFFSRQYLLGTWGGSKGEWVQAFFVMATYAHPQTKMTSCQILLGEKSDKSILIYLSNEQSLKFSQKKAFLSYIAGNEWHQTFGLKNILISNDTDIQTLISTFKTTVIQSKSM